VTRGYRGKTIKFKTMLNNLLSGLFGKVVDNAEGIIDEIVTTKEEKEKLRIELKRIMLEAEREAFDKEVEDRVSARNMYAGDAIIQKALAILFTTAYFGLSFVMFRYFVLNDIQLGDYEIGFISTIFGAMSAKVNTIIDFFFGGSSKDNK